MTDKDKTIKKTICKFWKEKKDLICKSWKEHRNYYIGLFIWTIACLLFSKPINTYLGKLGGFLFDSNPTQLKIYEWIICGLFLVYYLLRIINAAFWPKAKNALRGRILRILAPVVVWYGLNYFGLMKSEFIFLKSDLFLGFDLAIVFVFVFAIDLVISFLFFLIGPKKHTNSSSFITDVAYVPTDENPKDLLGFKPYAKRIADEAMLIKSKESVVFGINGQWGEGKTSMINMVKEELKVKKYSYVDFHPWKTSSGKAVNQLFFDVLKDGLKEKIVGINGKINRYAEALLQLDNTGIGKTLWQLLIPADSVETQKKQLQDAMQQLDKNLIVFVDDLDRLAQNEIADVLKLMRDTANFPNLVFIAAYDRSYLDNAIEETICSHEPKKYMDKIVLWEFPIQKPEIKSYIKELIKILKEKHRGIYEKEELYKMFIENKEHQLQFQDFNTIVKEAFTNLREVKRFCNSFTFEYNHLKNRKINFHDLFCLQLIRFLSKDYFDEFRKVFYKVNPKMNSGGFISKYFQEYIEQIKLEDVKKRLLNQVITYLITNNSTKKNNPNGFGKFTMARLYFQSNSDKYSLEDITNILLKENFEEYKVASDQLVEELKKEKWWNEEVFDYTDLTEANKFYPYFESIEDFTKKLKRIIYFSNQLDEFEFYVHIHDQIRINVMGEFSNKLISIQDYIRQQCTIPELNLTEFCILIIRDFENEKKANWDYISISDSLSNIKNEFMKNIKNGMIDIETIRLFKFSYQNLDENNHWVKDNEIIQLMRESAYQHPDQFVQFLILEDADSRKEFPEKILGRFSELLLTIFDSHNDLKDFFKLSNFKKRKDVAFFYSQFLDSGFKKDRYPETTDFKITLSPDNHLGFDLCTIDDLIKGKYSSKYSH